MVTLIGPFIAAWVVVFMLSLIVGPPQAHAGCWSLDTSGANANTYWICQNTVGIVCEEDPTPCIKLGAPSMVCTPVGESCQIGEQRPQLTPEQKAKFAQLASASRLQCGWLSDTVLGLKPDQIKPSLRDALRNCRAQTADMERFVKDPPKPDWKTLPPYNPPDIHDARGTSAFLNNREARDFNVWAKKAEEAGGRWDQAIEGFERGVTAREFPQCSLADAFRQARFADENLIKALEATAAEINLRLAITLTGLGPEAEAAWEQFRTNANGLDPALDLPASLVIDAFAAAPLPANCR